MMNKTDESLMFWLSLHVPGGNRLALKTVLSMVITKRKRGECATNAKQDYVKVTASFRLPPARPAIPADAHACAIDHMCRTTLADNYLVKL